MKTLSFVPIVLLLSAFGRHTQAQTTSPKQNAVTFYTENLAKRGFVFELYSAAGHIELPHDGTDTSDTVVVNEQLPLNLITVQKDSNQNYIHHSYPIKNDEVVYVRQMADGQMVVLIANDSIRNNDLSFYPAMQKTLGNFEGFMVDTPFKRLPATERLKKIKAQYKDRMLFLEKYTKSKTMSISFKTWVQKTFYYCQYIDFLELYEGDKTFKQTYKNSKPILDFINEMKIDDSNATMPHYINALLLKLYVQSTSNYENLYFLTKQKYSGLTQEILLYRIIDDAAKTNLDVMVSDFLKNTTNEVLKTHIISKYGYGNLVENQAVDKVQNKDIVIKLENKEKVSWQRVLTNGRIKYVDFWASWCSGCRLEMRKTKQLRDEYAQKGIDFVYVSIDANVGAWNIASKKETLSDAQSYLLPNSKKSAIAKQYNIVSVPRYIIIDKDGTVIDPNASTISNPNVRKTLDELLEKQVEK